MTRIPLASAGSFADKTPEASRMVAGGVSGSERPPVSVSVRRIDPGGAAENSEGEDRNRRELFATPSGVGFFWATDTGGRSLSLAPPATVRDASGVLTRIQLPAGYILRTPNETTDPLRGRCYCRIRVRERLQTENVGLPERGSLHRGPCIARTRCGLCQQAKRSGG